MRSTKKSLALPALVVSVVLCIGCDERLSDIAGPTPDLQPTFTSVQNEIFNTTDSAGRVGCTQCHTNQGRNPSAGLNLTPGNAYAALVNRPSVQKPGALLVIPGDPDNSYLVQKVEGAPGIVGQRMPRTAGPFLTPGQILILRRWIALGARND
ncbi:MAG TPA: hypothetical protein VNJ02_15245 [Vicinamibacterales bacterium]|nr:hypothetical protein [Vicinamibacterales bacterium]